MMSDLELLDQYARENRQEAFAALLDRHLKLVYSAALRQVRSPELAQEVAQSVFTDLARNASKLEPKTILTAWLYQVTRRTAIDVVRRESRRQLREQIAYDMTNMNANSSEWTAIEPLLDEAMESLDQSDRTAILLRFFEDKSLREVGQTLGTSEDAAQKRVSRALDLLREYFSKRGRAVAAGGLAAIITANAAQSAPAGLKAAILTSAAFSGASAPLVGTIGITKTLAMTTLQKALIGATLAAAVGTGLYEAQRASALQEQMQTLKRQSAPAAGQNDSLRKQLDEANRQLNELQAQLKKIHSDNEEVVRLRGEVARLRDNAARSDYDPTATAARSWLARVNQLKDRLQQTPAAKIPELQYLTDKDWLNVAKADLNTDEDYRRALGDLRNTAESAFISSALQPALKQYAQANNGQFPTDLTQLQQYFNPPVDDSVLQRWEVTPKSTMPNVGVGDFIVTQVAPVDADYDNRYAVGLNGWGTSSAEAWDGPSPASILKPALQAYAAANNGLEPTDPSQLTPFVTTPEQQAALQKLIQHGTQNSAFSIGSGQ
jgi:RNA polymerase sigma factor (sigma-70 family)